MAGIFFVGSILIFASCCTLGSPGLIGPRIVNGRNASDGEFPYAVSIRYFNNHECGGSIISEKWILTAAHCVYLNFTNVSNILYGTKNVEEGVTLTENIVNVQKAVVHPNWQNYGGYFNDIAVLEVQTPFLFSNTVAPVKLPEQDETPPFLEESTLVGWGYPYDNRTVAQTLQKVNIMIYPNGYCTTFFGANYSSTSQICAGGGGRGQCTGDSGGGLTHKGVQHGIVSWSDKPCATTPGVLTRVSNFRNWIKEVTGV